ncbi:uncharacterized protein F4822DRAFT_429475 [Hypoxylon trugodes]|uniref:uncharacterized protein n=1 Tax=Hypoxylon trugodes TaxID=326681 RepID=UPI002198923E|nr:uncharacterized protein F4822DRAFT_429475 [Hypoxylon trugodes]KAI1388858.1 hypothetical protein F4822DRAFT_429475 [Hypoxylon trugodes]
MNSTICPRCRTALRQSLRTLRSHHLRTISSSPSRSSPHSQNPASQASTSISEILSKPSWSVRSLLPSSSTSTSDETITPKTLHHLLRLSALPPPSSPEEESRMLSTLQSQLHFVRAARDVDTTGVESLRAIRDETTAGLREQAIGLDRLRDALAREDVVGHARRPRRRHREESRSGRNKEAGVEGWDVLGGASETAGRYFVVRTGSSKPA